MQRLAHRLKGFCFPCRGALFSLVAGREISRTAMSAIGASFTLFLFILLILASPAMSAPLAHGTLITNVAEAQVAGVPQSQATNNLIIVVRTDSQIEFLRYAPGATNAENIQIQTPEYAPRASLAGPFLPLPNPPLVGGQKIDLSQPVPLLPAYYYHMNDPIFIRLTDLDQNLHSDLIETVLITITSATGDTEVLRLYETGPDTGIYVGYTQSTMTMPTNGDGKLTISQSCTVDVKYRDLADHSDTSATAALFDPLGTIFDSSNGAPIDGASVSLIDATTGLLATVLDDNANPGFPATVISGQSLTVNGITYSFPPGGYRFPLLLPGSYRLVVDPPAGWTMPSTVSTLDLQRLPGAPWEILEPGSRGGDFIVGNIPVLKIDIPVDPAVAMLWVEKTPGKEVVAIGDFLPYTIKVTNTSDKGIAKNTQISDRLPLGFRYRKGSALTDGVSVNDPSISPDGRTLTFALGTLTPKMATSTTYVVEVAAGAKPGKAMNTAAAVADGGVSSNIAKAIVKVREDLFRSRAFVVGQVMESCEEDAKGIAGVRIYLEDGSFVVTDERGLYHFEGIRPGTHVVQIDTLTLPNGYKPISCTPNSRFSGSNLSQFIDLQGGTLWRADFYAAPPPPDPSVGSPPDLSEKISITPSPVIGSTSLTLSSTISGDIVTYQIEINEEVIGNVNPQLIINLPSNLSPTEGSLLIDGLPAGELQLVDEKYTLSLPGLTEGQKRTVSFKAMIPGNAEGEMTAEAIIRFDADQENTQQTPEAINRFSVIKNVDKNCEDYTLSPYFESGTDILSKADHITIERITNFFKGYDIERVEIIGHTDNVRLSKRTASIFQDNIGLSKARAAAIAKIFNHFLGLPDEKVIAIGKGETEPIADNRRESGRALNRRVEIKLYTCKKITSTDLALDVMDSGPQSVVTSKIPLPVPIEQTLSEIESIVSPPVEPPVISLPAEKTAGILSLSDGAVLVNSIQSIRVQIDSRLKPKLTIDDQEVPDDRIGFTMADKKTGKTLYSYIGVDLGKPGVHQVTIRGMDPFGNARFNESVNITVTSAPKRMRFIEEANNIADGITPVKVRIQFLDDKENIIKTGLDLEIVKSSGLIPFNPKASAVLSGSAHQTVHVNPDGWIEFAPVTTSGTTRVELKYADLPLLVVEPYVKAPLRDWILVGLAEGTVGYNTLDGNMESLTAGAEDAFYDDGRIAFFAKGQVKGEWLLTAAYDTAKGKEGKLHGTIDPDSYYTLYGDASSQQYEAASARKLYVKIERDQFYALFGDFDTGLTVTELASYSRSLNGFKSELKSRFFNFNLFASDTTQAFMRNEIPGDGTSGLYPLKNKNIVINSEKIVIETRDRFHSETILNSRSLIRHADYDIDYDLGTLFFKEPIASRDQEFNPIMIVIDYETMDAGKSAFNYGGRIALKLHDDNVVIGVSRISDGTIGAGGDLSAIDASIKISPETTIRGEFASTNSTTQGTNAKGNAYLAEATHRSEALDGRIYLREQQRHFGLGQQRTSEIGTKKFGGDARYRLLDNWTIDGELSHLEQSDTNNRQDLGRASVTYQQEKYNLNFGLRDVTDRLGSGETNRSTQGLFGASWQISKKTILRLNHEQSLFSSNGSADYPTRTSLGADYRLSETVSFFTAQEWTFGDKEKTDMTRAGLKTTPWNGAVLNSTISQERSEYGPRLFATTGLNQTWQIDGIWSLSGGIDRNQTIKDPGNVPVNGNAAPASGGNEDFTALTLGFDRKVEKWSWSNRFEFRASDNDDKIGLYTGAEGEIRQGVALSSKFQIFETKQTSGVKILSGDMRFGLAWRPLSSKWIIFDRLDYLFDRQSGTESNLKNWRFINNLHANFHPDSRTQLSIQYGAKYVREEMYNQNYSGYTDLTGVEGRYDLTKVWDMGLHASILHSWSSSQIDYRTGASIGYSLVKNAWISAGYNFVGFTDRDFSAADFTAQGPFVKFRLKFDQNSVREALKQF